MKIFFCILFLIGFMASSINFAFAYILKAIYFMELNIFMLILFCYADYKGIFWNESH